METTIKVGDILAGTWGYSMTIPCFYKVLAITEKRLRVVEIEKRMVRHDGFGQQGYEIPDELGGPRFGKAKAELARPSKYQVDKFVVGGRYDRRYLTKWDNKPIWADYMD